MSKKLLIILLVAGALGICCLAVVGVVAYKVTQDDDKNDSQDEQQDNNDEDNNSDEDSADNDAANGDDNSDDNGTDKEVCELLTKSEAEDILGLTVSNPTASENNSCTYIASDFSTISVFIATTDGSDAENSFNTAKSAVYDNDIDEVDLDGADEAYWGDPLNQLNILKDDTWILITVYTDDEAKSKAAGIAAGEIVAERF